MRNKALTVLVISGLVLAATGCESQQSQAPAQDTAATSDSATNSDAATTTGPSTGDPARYCRLTEQLEASGQTVFADLGRDATAADYQSAERRFALDNRTTLRALEAAVPDQLRDDVRSFVTAMRQRGGLEPGGTVTQAEASAAERAIRAFERRACRE